MLKKVSNALLLFTIKCKIFVFLFVTFNAESIFCRIWEYDSPPAFTSTTKSISEYGRHNPVAKDP